MPDAENKYSSLHEAKLARPRALFAASTAPLDERQTETPSANDRQVGHRLAVDSSDQAKTALLFPGQGAVTEAERDLVEERTPGLLLLARNLLGYDPFLCLEQGSRFRQAATYCASIASLTRIRFSEITVAAYAGHSMGEIAALVGAGALSQSEGLRIAVRRGQLVDELLRDGDPGAMAVVRCSPEQGHDLARANDVSVAAYNSPKQVVLTGASNGIGQVLDSARTWRLRAQLLPICGAFHSPALEFARGPYEEFLGEIAFRPTRWPVLSGVSASAFQGSEARLLAQSLTEPVLWTEVIGGLAESGIERFLDVGPGSGLARMVGEIVPEASAEPLSPIAPRPGRPRNGRRRPL